ncbi:hypothetical protein HQ496_05805 [bacterium]|nr:hypothetical protein [bacterium]
MKNRLFFLALLLALVFVGCAKEEAVVETAWIPPAPSAIVEGVTYTSGNWEPYLAAGEAGLSWGNHRAVVTFSVEASLENAVEVTIPWRRLDTHPELKAIVVVDSSSGNAIPDAFAKLVSRESGTVVFKPTQGSFTYYVYYLPWESTGGYYPKVTYPSNVYSPDPKWSASVGTDLPKGQTVRMESVSDFHSFFPMEVPATAEETERFTLSRSPDWFLIGESGRMPIRTNKEIPYHWVSRPIEPFTTTAYRDESHVFQVAVFAPGDSLQNLAVSFVGFDERLATSMTCFSCGGMSFEGEPFIKSIDVEKGELLPLWIGLKIPENMPAGEYAGKVRVMTENMGFRDASIVINVRQEKIKNHGYDDPASQARLFWLNSQTGRDQDFIIHPYTPVSVDGNTVSILGRDVVLGSNGLPQAINSYFTEEMTGLSNTAAPILAEPMGLVVSTLDGKVSFNSGEIAYTTEGLGRTSWSVTSTSSSLTQTVEGALEYDGMLDYQITLTATEDLQVEDISLPVAYQRDAATYMLGLGEKGRRRPDSKIWKWKVENHQEGVWLGAVNKGLQYVLRDNNYVRPLNTNFYQNQPLNMPDSWFNEGKGGIKILESAEAVVANNYSGSRTIKAGESLHFNVRMLITPFKPLDTKTHFNTRFVHKYVPVDSVKAWGGTVVNIHHANEINPYINYPFYNLEEQTAYITEAHEKGIKVKLYDTIRELTYKAYEMFAMRSFGDEIFNGGDGGGHSWMQEHLRGDYHSAWHAYRVDDAAILNKGTSRWTNYYIEGLSWLAANQKIDGLYLDDIAFSRETVKRMISVLYAEREEVVIDLHSANQFNPADGFTNSAMLYMEHFPFISRLWFGEYFQYDLGPDYWMTEVSGLPFGLMGEMLQDGGHPYRGMLYGMTARMYGDVDPRPVWKLMNDFGIEDSRMLGYWLSKPPVETGNDLIKATAFVRPDGVLIALASWSSTDETVVLDLANLGLPAGASISIPGVAGLQEAGAPSADGSLVIPANMGLYVLVKK